MLMITADELLQIRVVRHLLQMSILYFYYDFKETLMMVLVTKLRMTYRSSPSRNLLEKCPQRHH